MRIGLQIPNFTYPGKTLAPTLKDIVQLVDQGGFYSIWVMDHFFQIPGVGEADQEMLEGYTTLGYFAGLTQKVKLGTMVSGVIYRYPGILVKTVTTLDVVSNGRAYFGIGAAWFEREAKGLGVPFPPIGERFERLEEALHIAYQMWSGSRSEFHGKYYQLAETLTSPRPVSQPHPPILIGGMGEKKTLRLVAQYADACNLFLRAGNDVLQEKLDVLKRHCDQLARPYDQIEKTALGSIGPGPVNVAEVVAECRQLAEMGFSQAIYNFANVQEMTALETFVKEVVPAVAEF